MTRRVQVLWLPAVAAIVTTEILLFLLTWAGARPWTIPLDWHVFHSHHPLQFYVPWLAALPFVAAASALWSRRRGGTAREAGKVALAPAVAALGLIVVSTPLDILVDVVIQRSHTLEHTFCGTAWALVSFALAPGLALALGFVVAAVWWHRAPRAGVKAVQPQASRV
jgi:hypothetical protein